MLNLNPSPKVTVEDLLRLKRSERPSADFWDNFERELRDKQLTALLKKRAWWQELPQFLVRRAYIPVGATAALAFTLVTVKYYSGVQGVQVEGTPYVAVAEASAIVDHSLSGGIVQVSSPLVNRSDGGSSGLARLGDVEPVHEKSSPVADSIELMPANLATRDLDSPSARSIAANLAHLEQSEPELVNAYSGSRLSSSPARVQTAALGELASIPTNGGKRSRLLAQYNDRPLNPEPTAPDIVRERLARRLGDSDMTDRISRLGLRGDQVSLRF